VPPLPTFVTATACDGGFAPPAVAANATLVGASPMAGCASATTVSVTATVAGEFAATGEATATVAVYVPGTRPAWFALRMSDAGAVVPDRLADSQPVGCPAPYVTAADRPVRLPVPAFVIDTVRSPGVAPFCTPVNDTSSGLTASSGAGAASVVAVASLDGTEQ
jgi:hypothetical protein